MKSSTAALAFLVYFCYGADAKKIVCPEASEIAPVNCTRKENDDGTSTTSLVYDSRIKSTDEIAAIVQKIRTASGCQPEDLLEIDDCSFMSLGKNLETIDMSIFGRNNVTNLKVEGQCPQIIGGQKDALYISNFFVINSPKFAPDNLNAALTGFAPSALKTLYIHNADLVGFPSALNTLTALRILYILNGKVSKVESRQFSGNPDLVWLYLYNTSVTEIQEKAFEFSEARQEKSLYVLLAVHPLLTDANIHPNHGLEKVQGVAMVSFTKTGVTSLSQRNWEGFLTDKNHFIMFSNNPLQCSPEMRWIKTAEKRLKRQVYSADCANDKGKNVFNSELV